MNDADHHKVVALAVSALPPPSRSFWEPLHGDIEATCMLPDQVAIALLNGEDGPWRQYFPADAYKHSFEKHGASARAQFFDVRFYVEHVLGAFERGDIAEACRFVGVFSHCLSDFAEPAHYCEKEITLLAPPPPERMNCNSHRMIEDIRSTITEHSYRAQPLGHTADTVIMRLEGRLRLVYERAMASAIPMLQAIYRDDLAAAAGAVDQVIAGAVEVMGDFLHTAWGIHRDSWTDEERLALASCRLDALEPAAYDVEFNYGFRPIRDAITLDQLGAATALQLDLDGPRTVEGLCVVPHALPIKGAEYCASMDFDLPPDEFSRLTATIGLLAGFQPQAICRFVVEGDGQALFEGSPMRAEDTAARIEVDISGIQRLRLIVHTDGSTDKLAFPIWAWPTIEGDA